MESLDLRLRKDLRLNKMSDSLPPICSLPILFPEWSHLPHLYRRSVHCQPGVLSALFNGPNLGGIQVCQDHVVSYLCLFSSKDVSES